MKNNDNYSQSLKVCVESFSILMPPSIFSQAQRHQCVFSVTIHDLSVCDRHRLAALLFHPTLSTSSLQARRNGRRCLHYARLATIFHLFPLKQELSWRQHSSWCSVSRTLVRALHSFHFIKSSWPCKVFFFDPLWSDTSIVALPESFKCFTNCMCPEANSCFSENKQIMVSLV